MATSYPWMQFVVSDWLAATAMCSPATRGIWLDALGAMHLAGRTGIISGTYDQLARVCRCSRIEMELTITELEQLSVADVKRGSNASGDMIVTLINRRMQREDKDRTASKIRMNKMRGNGDVTPHFTDSVTPSSRGTSGRVTRHNSESESDKKGESASLRARANMSIAGNPAERGEESEPESPPVLEAGKQLSPSERITREKELKRVESELDRIRERIEGGHGIDATGKLRRAELRERRTELLDILGMKA